MKADERWRPTTQKPEQQVCHQSHDEYLDLILYFGFWFIKYDDHVDDNDFVDFVDDEEDDDDDIYIGGGWSTVHTEAEQ